MRAVNKSEVLLVWWYKGKNAYWWLLSHPISEQRFYVNQNYSHERWQVLYRIAEGGRELIGIDIQLQDFSNKIIKQSIASITESMGSEQLLTWSYFIYDAFAKHKLVVFTHDFTNARCFCCSIERIDRQAFIDELEKFVQENRVLILHVGGKNFGYSGSE